MTTRLTPFAETMLLRRENKRVRDELMQMGLSQAANEAEARGALMLICVLVEQSENGELRIPMADLVAAHGRVRRTLDQETNEVVFTVAPEDPAPKCDRCGEPMLLTAKATPDEPDFFACGNFMCGMFNRAPESAGPQIVGGP
jgi:hypothetical protein